ncbi:hypothetical protein D9M73_64560 [compost metagenome]
MQIFAANAQLAVACQLARKRFSSRHEMWSTTSHAKVPLLAFAGLVHLGVACPVRVLGRAGRADDGGIHDGAGVDLETFALQHKAYLSKQGFTELVVIE